LPKRNPSQDCLQYSLQYYDGRWEKHQLAPPFRGAAR
jgi:hypothetical protein